MNLIKNLLSISIESICKRQLEAAQRDLLEHAGLAEYHTAMVQMLTRRIERLSSMKD